jgi:glyoxylase-like metal-dependent hydrolase (beta-lactamase superfamily II)
MSPSRLLVSSSLTLVLAACSSAPTTRQLAQDAAAASGGVEQLRGIRTLVMRGGEGTRLRLGQAVRVGDEQAPATLTNVVETIDLANGRAAMDYELRNGDFTQHRQEVLTTKGDDLVGLENVPGRPLAVMSPTGLFSWGSQNSPEMLLRRNVVTVLLAAADSPSDEAPQARELDGRPHTFGTATLPSGESVGLYFDDASKRLAAFETMDTEAMLGDVPAQYRLGDYRAAGDVILPHTITIRKDGQPYSEVRFESIAVNDAAADEIFAIPDEVAAEVDRAIAEGDYSPITLTPVADGVHFARAYSHHSMIVEFPSWLAVVEAPYTDAQSLTLARALEEQFPGKPIRYAAVTHPHYDHIGGVRGLAAQGATVLVAREHAPVIRLLLDSPHTHPADALETKRRAQEAVGSMEIFEGRTAISDGGQTLELYAVSGFPHVDPKVLAYVPTARVLFQSDLFFPGTGGGASPDAVHLLQSVRDLNLRVNTNIGGHGGVAPFAELEKAVGSAANAN